MSYKWMSLILGAFLIVGVAWSARSATAEECDPLEVCAAPVDGAGAEPSPVPFVCPLIGCEIPIQIETPDGYRDIVMIVSFSEDGVSLSATPTPVPVTVPTRPSGLPGPTDVAPRAPVERPAPKR